YDVYAIDLSCAGTDDLHAVLLDTTPRPLILVEDLDWYLCGGDGEGYQGTGLHGRRYIRV
uniref:Uncharacterized protein n=1 Tax=Aegilops tauschii subsp. strangulata TaxID=200361 RepID=A0A453L504_AEGTS